MRPSNRLTSFATRDALWTKANGEPIPKLGIRPVCMFEDWRRQPEQFKELCGHEPSIDLSDSIRSEDDVSLRVRFSPSIVARPSSSRPSSRKKSIVPPRSSTTIPTLSILLSAMLRIYTTPPNTTTGALQRRNTSAAEFAKTPEQPLIGASHGRS